MHLTVTITPQRAMIFFIMVAIWYCFMINDNMDGDNSNLIPPIPKIFVDPYDTPSFNPDAELSLSDPHHTQRILKQIFDTPDMTTNTGNTQRHIKVPPIPSVVGIGPEKCGTTSMAYMLSRHPDKIPELMKPVHEPTGIDCEMRVWLPCGNRNFKETLTNVLRDGNPDKGRNFCSLGWYAHFWTPHHDDIRFLNYYTNSTSDLLANTDHKEYKSEDPRTWRWKYYYYFEKSPAYWCYEHVAYLFHKLLVPQGTKFFVLLRDPLKRTFSYWSHQTQIGHLRHGGSWPNFIQNSLHNVHLQKMIGLLRDDNQSILEIKEDLLKTWSDYVYAESYGYIGRRDDTTQNRKPKIPHRVQRRKGLDIEDQTSRNTSTRRRLWTQRDPGYVGADTNPKLGVGASCYVIPLLMWLQYVPVGQMSVMQSELMYGGNHNKFVSDVRCWVSVGYEYDTMEECQKDGKKNVEVPEEHMTMSSKNKVHEQEAQALYNGLFKFCNKRLKELLEMDEFKSMMLHQIAWDKWYGTLDEDGN
eukprot:233833_1